MQSLAIVFDWDDVIFNTAKFKGRLADILAKQEDVPRKTVFDSFGVAKDAHGYNPAIHARMIATAAGGNKARIAKTTWSACRSLADKLMFPDAVPTLHAIRKDGTPMYVLSAGRRRFQETRIYGSKLTHLFRGIHIVDVTSPDAAVATKAKVLARLARRHEKLIFLDDRPKTIAGISKSRQLRGKVLPVLVWRKKETPPRVPAIIRRLSWREIKKIAIHNGFGPY